MGIGSRWSVLTSTGVAQLAFVATPAMFHGAAADDQAARWAGPAKAPWWSWLAVAGLAVAVVPPLVELTLALHRRDQVMKALLELNHPLMQELQRSSRESPIRFFLVLAVLPALCEELAFRGFISPACCDPSVRARRSCSAPFCFRCIR